jgi:hypothetical protein
MNKCKQCGNHTTKPTFCSFSCATRWRNLNTNLAKKGREALTLKLTSKANDEKELYKQNPTFCKACTKPLSFDKRSNKFCSTTCRTNSLANNTELLNRQRLSRAATWEEKRKNKVSKRQEFNNAKELGLISAVFFYDCKHCSSSFTAQQFRKYCNNCSTLYSHNGRAKYWFTLNVFQYPDLFDLNAIKEIGFRSKENPNGLTRDHRYSVNEAIKHNRDPFYVKHPINCEILPFDENNKKKTKCSITWEQLVEEVNAYETAKAPK